MKKHIYLSIFLLLFVASCFCTNAQQQPIWKLIWSDEFNYTGLPDSAIWGYETGHVRNKEQQYYTRAQKENVWVSNGMLSITGKKQLVQNQYYQPGSADWRYKNAVAHYTSASINSLHKRSIHYGRVEIRAKLPTGGGIWPAFWLMGVNREKIGWPLCGEIDMMEYIGNHPTHLYSTVHYPDSTKQKSISNGSKILDSTLQHQFNTYAMEWDIHTIKMFFNDLMIHRFEIDIAGKGKDNPFRKPFYLLINLAMGASWPGPIDDTVLPQQLLVDYVRVFTLN